MKKEILKNKKGITLIALVVTIVVLLILAGVSIAMFTGENGRITQAQTTKENTRGEEVKEAVEMAANENKMYDYEPGNKKSKSDVITDLVGKGKLTAKEATELDNKDVIKIGDIEIDFSILGDAKTEDNEGNGDATGITMEEAYNDEMVGTVIKNTTLDEKLPKGTEWIILGKDEDESIMLTTSKPIENGFILYYTGEAWLSYEDDLDEACAIYGATIQGQEVKARSITLEDVNRVTGYQEPVFDTYTFGNILDYENKQVDYCYPDAESDNFWSKNEGTYKNNVYNYSADDTVKNMNIILGENSNYYYLLGSRYVAVYSSGAYFHVADVSSGSVGSNGNFLCYSYSGNFIDYGNSYMLSVRPIINLPSNIQVQEVNGEWRIVD